MFNFWIYVHVERSRFSTADTGDMKMFMSRLYRQCRQAITLMFVRKLHCNNVITAAAAEQQQSKNRNN